jgi:beta-fructofuranosidase
MSAATLLDDALRERLARDPHRPRYHFLPPAQWMNDPNGLIQWRGRYHLFYQHHPFGPLWANMHWGHAVSDDLVHWRHLPIALAPTPGGPDEDGVFSGCAVDDDGVPTIVYSGVRGKDQLVCLATAADPDDPDLVVWKKHPGNPVIPAHPEGAAWVAYRDPSVWREGDAWYMVHGAGIVDVGGTALLYRAADLIEWEYLGPIHTGDLARREPIWTGSMWECPQLFPLGDRHVLLIAVWFRNPPQPSTHYTAYMTGHFDGQRFTPEQEGLLDVGALYAPQTMRDERGRRLLWGWLRETRSDAAQTAAGWSGAMTIPWLLTPRPDGALGIAPVPELEALRWMSGWWNWTISGATASNWRSNSTPAAPRGSG